MSKKTESATTAPGNDAPAMGIFNEPSAVTVPSGVTLINEGLEKGTLEIPNSVNADLGRQAKAALESEPGLRDTLWQAVQNRLIFDECCGLIKQRWQAQLLNEQAEAAQQRRDNIIKSGHHAFASLDVSDEDELLYFLASARINAKLRPEVFTNDTPGGASTWHKDSDHSTVSLAEYMPSLRKQAREFRFDVGSYRLALCGVSPLTVLLGASADLNALSGRFKLPTTLAWSGDDGEEIRIYAGGSGGYFPQKRGNIGVTVHSLKVWKSISILSADDSCALPWPRSDAKWIVTPKQFEQSVKSEAMCELPTLSDELAGILRDCSGASSVILPRAIQMMIDRKD
jgi:hypothetical protein